MNGVEAAASLFGSEESGSDLFSTLGGESTSPHPPPDGLFTSNASNAEEAETFDFASRPDSYPVQHSTFTEYPSNTEDHKVSDNVQYSSSAKDLARQWDNHHQQDVAPDYSSYATHRADVPPQTTGYNTYAPTTYTAPTTAYSAYSAYDPPAAASSYDPYAPTSHTKAPSNPSYLPPVLAPPSSLDSSYSKGIASIPPVPTPTKSTVTRPKVSNAYDPPFLQTLPSRKAPRSASSGAQLYSQFQSYVQPPYPQAVEAPTSYGQYQQPPVIHNQDAPPSTELDSNLYSRGVSYTNPVATEQSYSHGTYSPQQQGDSTFQTNSTSQAKFEQTYPPPRSLAFDSTNEASLRIPSEEAYDPANYANESHANEHKSSSAPLNSLNDVIHGVYDHPGANDPPLQTVSPRTVPLPFSPPQTNTDVEDPEATTVLSGDDTQNKLPPPPQPKSYAPPPPQRREMSMNREIHDPYAPKHIQSTNNYIPRTSSPLSISHGPVNERKPPVNAGLNTGNGISSTFGAIPRPLVGITPHVPLGTVDNLRPASHWSDKFGPQDVIVKNTAAQYAPSPSLIGANDPLSRTSARAPVVTFGFGGKMVTCFHGMAGQNAGFDVALSSRTSSELKIHVMQKFLPESVLTTSGTAYPGPLLADPGTSSISLVRPGQNTQTKTKKAGVIAYLASRASEIHQGLGYFVYAEKQAAEDKLVLVKLLSIMVENDGRLLGIPQAESAVRSALVPRLESLTNLQDGVSLQAFNTGPVDETPISVVTLRPSTLDRIEDLLLQGERRQAYQFAMDQKLWAHAMIIASSIDKESWKEVVSDFLRTELSSKEEVPRGVTNGGGIQSHKNNRESLRVAYSLYSGQGPAAVQELAPVNLLQRATGRLQVQTPIAPLITPRTPNFPVLQQNLPAEALSNWAQTAAMIISSPLTPETSGALTALGDQLLSHNWVEAAHSCYLLSSQSSLLGGFGNPSTRITLVGSKNPGEAMKDSDAIILSEILEFAMSLVPTVKGHEPFHGLPHLQAYRFIRAISLAEIGDIQLANRYCEAIASSLSQTSPYTSAALLEQLQGLQQRISGVVHGEKGGSWIGGKLSKPSLDTIGGWLEGRFTKLVTGDTDEPSHTDDQAKSAGQPFAGPFAHYSTISSTTPSARSSPQPSFSNPTSLPPQRTTSAMATSSPYSQIQIERASSAMGYMRQRPPAPTNEVTSISSSQSSPTGYSLNGQSRYDTYTSKYNTTAADEAETPVQGGSSWWGTTDEASSSTPTAATFMSVDETSIQPSSDGFISLMDNNSFAIGPQQVSQQSSRSTHIEDDEDDLGLGNSKPKPKKADTDEGNEVVSATVKSATPTPPKPADPPAAASGGSWLGRWWKRSESTTPAPIKASLGEESSFYYDKEQKRWVNKKAGGTDEAPKAAPPPPPSRAQTASPGMSNSKSQSPAGPPPPRSASAIDLSTEPPLKAPMRIRSNLAPPTESAPSTPTGTRMNTGPPPPGRPKSSAAKRNVRSRYVDVFQQEGGAA
uniref:Protein transport protein sec16 n=1 Tax=Psilocybe cubensis TaxID=181762 RepID=A0A8H7Y1B2_PSICU